MISFKLKVVEKIFRYNGVGKGNYKYPVLWENEYDSWSYCQKFIKELNRITGLSFRLPTEAEWEFAARGGNKSQGYKYSGSNNIDDVGWYGGNSQSSAHPVANKQPNELGLYDMSGNAAEWCSDYYAWYTSAAQTNPTGPSSGSNGHVNRGSWYGGHIN